MGITPIQPFGSWTLTTGGEFHSALKTTNIFYGFIIALSLLLSIDFFTFSIEIAAIIKIGNSEPNPSPVFSASPDDEPCES